MLKTKLVTNKNKPQIHAFDVMEAKKKGLKEAIILGKLRYLCRKNLEQKRFWAVDYVTKKLYACIYTSTRDFVKLFPYLERRTLTNLIKRMIDKGYLLRIDGTSDPENSTNKYCKSYLTIPDEFLIDEKHPVWNHTDLEKEMMRKVKHKIIHNADQLLAVGKNIPKDKITPKNLTMSGKNFPDISGNNFPIYNNIINILSSKKYISNSVLHTSSNNPDKPVNEQVHKNETCLEQKQAQNALTSEDETSGLIHSCIDLLDDNETDMDNNNGETPHSSVMKSVEDDDPTLDEFGSKDIYSPSELLTDESEPLSEELSGNECQQQVNAVHLCHAKRNCAKHLKKKKKKETQSPSLVVGQPIMCGTAHCSGTKDRSLSIASQSINTCGGITVPFGIPASLFSGEQYSVLRIARERMLGGDAPRIHIETPSFNSWELRSRFFLWRSCILMHYDVQGSRDMFTSLIGESTKEEIEEYCLLTYQYCTPWNMESPENRKYLKELLENHSVDKVLEYPYLYLNGNAYLRGDLLEVYPRTLPHLSNTFLRAYNIIHTLSKKSIDDRVALYRNEYPKGYVVPAVLKRLSKIADKHFDKNIYEAIIFALSKLNYSLHHIAVSIFVNNASEALLSVVLETKVYCDTFMDVQRLKAHLKHYAENNVLDKLESFVNRLKVDKRRKTKVINEINQYKLHVKTDENEK